MKSLSAFLDILQTITGQKSQKLVTDKLFVDFFQHALDGVVEMEKGFIKISEPSGHGRRSLIVTTKNAVIG